MLFLKYSWIHRFWITNRFWTVLLLIETYRVCVCVCDGSEDALTDCVVCIICFAVSRQLFEVRFLKWAITNPQWLSMSILELQKINYWIQHAFLPLDFFFFFKQNPSQNTLKEEMSNIGTEREQIFNICSVLAFNFCQTLLLHMFFFPLFSWGKKKIRTQR